MIIVRVGEKKIKTKDRTEKLKNQTEKSINQIISFKLSSINRMEKIFLFLIRLRFGRIENSINPWLAEPKLNF